MNPDYFAGPLPLRFDADCVLAFKNASYDHNPLHCDPMYARKTQFGERVMFGVAVVLAALGRVFGQRPLMIKDIKVTFYRPVFPAREYTVEGRVKAGIYSITVRATNRVHVRIKVALRADRAVSTADELPATSMTPPLASGRTPTVMRYSLNAGAYREFCREIDLWVGLLPPAQLNALLWSSYFVGMVNPGEQGLFATLQFAFDASADREAVTDFAQLEYECDDRYSMVQITGMGTGISSFVLTAMSRPLPVRYSIQEVGEALGQNHAVLAYAKTEFGGKRIFVSGGSRGLGSVFARGFAHLGAVVIAGCRYQSADADDVAADLRALNGASGVLVADLADAAAFRRTTQSIIASASFDVLVCNASPVITSAAFVEMRETDIADFVRQSLQLFLTPLGTFLPWIAAGGRVVVISSEYASRPEAKFSHYVAAKRAIEGCTEALAKEYPATEFIILRPPRFLSDQTTSVLADSSLPSAIEIFRTFITRLVENKPATTPNLRYFDW